MKQLLKIKLPIPWQLILKVKSHLILVLLRSQTLTLRIKPNYTRNNLFQRSLTPPRITRMICNCRYHLLPETMQSTWVPYIWDHQKVNLLESFLILALNISLSPVPSVMIKLPVTLNSKNMIHCQAPSSRETNWTKDARLKPMIWKNQIQIRSSQRHLQSWHTVQLNSKDSFGKITLVSNHLRVLPPKLRILNCN